MRLLRRSQSITGSGIERSTAPTLTPAQQRMYKDEKGTNFRLIARALQSTAPTTLTPSDVVPQDLVDEIKDIGQFVELSYSPIALDFAFEHIRTLTEAQFPLEGYEALFDAKLVSEFRSERAGVMVYLAYREREKQLVVSFSGTVTLTQIYYDLSASLRSYPSSKGKSKCRVHSGFYNIYASLAARVAKEIADALGRYDVQDLVVAGHSMGGALAYLLVLDLLKPGERVAPVVTLVTFGCPRVGDARLTEYWWGLKSVYEEKHGADAVRELTIRAHKDGVAALPPLWTGYRHLCRIPLYFTHNTVFCIPESDRDFGLFNAIPPEGAVATEHPKGGHNYYNGRDMERGARRMALLDTAVKAGKEGWEERYRVTVKRVEGGGSRMSFVWSS
ncbi:alpha/beta-hydrolase [Pterulicium gracile]|uniref:Alpha/beta-hydrolase n=1 Tax=Pterulicium gracile TaxID=1884261 RepID=A0A5C3QP43_9AGAR|nr:alpha/beta-hydrolase [Pterula gracilis]